MDINTRISGEVYQQVVLATAGGPLLMTGA